MYGAVMSKPLYIRHSKQGLSGFLIVDQQDAVDKTTAVCRASNLIQSKGSLQNAR